ncbi:MAG: hypothetical protein U0Z26_04810 [Anaerolineales bacterium]
MENLLSTSCRAACSAGKAEFTAALQGCIVSRGIDQLYSHRSRVDTISCRQNIILSTGTAGGKTLSYNLPVLATMLQNLKPAHFIFSPPKLLPKINNRH